MRSAAGGRAVSGSTVILFLLAAVTHSAHAEAECDDAHANENETDAGGDDCSYYAIFPAHCGCCDTPSFSAAACCACQAGSVDGNASWWTSVFLSWPRKARTLRLPKKRISTEFPLDFAERWPFLEEVNLNRNYLTGSLPAQLGGLSNLSKLDLSSNKLTGPLPRELGNLSQLQELTLSGNSLSGSLPRELGGLSQLRVLRLSDNSLSGSLPRELGNLSQLQDLRLSENGLRGSLPRELGNLSQLQELRLSDNSLSGSLPRELWSLSELQVLLLSRNSLSGSLPMELGNLTHLVELDLYKNDFSGGLPRELGSLESLRRLDLSFNRLSGGLPPELGQLGNLRELFLEENGLTGELPPELGKLKGLEWLYLYKNQLSGALPHDLGNLTRLTNLRLEENQLTGSLPRELSQLTRLQELSLANNQFNGSLPPEFGMLRDLERLHLQGNLFTGALPAGFGDLRYLWELKLYSNRLSGELPPELGNLSYLMFLDLSHNNFSGSLPPEFGRLTWLAQLKLNHNQLGGSLPMELGFLIELGELFLHHNRLSGHLPPELGKLSRLRQLELQENQFSGGLPSELGRLSDLKDLLLQQNQLAGPLPPQLGGLSGLRTLRLQGNNLSGGLPASFTGLSELVVLEVAQNPLLCGDAQVLEELPNLQHLNLRGCCFDDSQLPSLPPELQHLDMGENRLSRVPSRWHEQGLSLRTLLIDGNNITQWNTSAIVPLSERSNEGWLCGYVPPGRPFAWAQLERLDVSSNPLGLGVFVYDFLESLSPLSQLRSLGARDCNLTGAVPLIEEEKLVPGLPHVGYPEHFCLDFPTASEKVSFPMLRTLDLSGNSIVALLSGPSAQLESMDLSRNALSALSSVWWEVETSLVSLDIRDNPALQLPVLLGLDAADAGIDVNAAVPSSCQSSGASRLTADVHRWGQRPGGTAECTSLCPMSTVVLHVDATVNESVLCRCTTGQGVGLDCDPCHNDSYSDLALTSMSTPEANYHQHYRRTCLHCPLASHLRGGQGVCFTDCTCVAGYYMAQVFNGTVQEVGFTPCSRLVKAEGRCVPCGLFETSLPGSRRAADCVCNDNQAEGGWGGLLESGGQCGCAAGYHMNFRLRECEPCQLEEDCGSFAQSLRPPIVKAGYWALPAPAEGGDGLFGNFSHHDIWRCESTSACPVGDACGLNRTGTACGLCKQGHFRSPSGWCQPCLRSYKATRRFVAGLFVPLMAFPILAHAILTADSNARGLIMTLRSFRISLRQVVKFAQVLGLVSLFSVEWPGLVSAIFAGFRFFSLDFASWTGVACLDEQQQQTMTKELVYRWMMAPAGVVITCCAALLATFCSCVLDQAWCCRRSCRCLGSKLESRIRRILRFSLSDLIRVLIFFLHLFYPSLLGSALIPLSCSPSPNGHMTMNAFPHVVCSLSHDSDQGFLPVALVGLAQSMLLGLGFPILLVIAWKRLRISRQIHIRTTVAESEGNEPHHLEERRRWWMFLFEDYRSHKMFWVLVSLTKDILLNFVIVLLPGLGTAQLLVTAVISGSYACLTFYVSPYEDWSNTLLETCTAGSVAGLCLFSAGLGFQFEQGVPDLGHYIAGGRDGSVYLQRTLTIGILQGLSVVGPAVIMFFQLLSPFTRCHSFIPRSIRPLSAAQREEWSQVFASAMRLNGSPMPRALAAFDDLDFCAFRQAVCSVPLVRNSLKTCARVSANQSEDNDSAPALRTEIAELRRQIAALSAENEAYREETLQLRSTMAVVQRAGSGVLPLNMRMSL